MNEISLDAFGTTLAGLRAGTDGGKRCLCLHGWMDNAASFVPLQGAMPALDIVAIDSPGHGKSAHFPQGHQYHLIDQVAYVLTAADALGWQEFNLIGHSLGGCIAPFVAIAAPERIDNVIMIEALGPMTEDAGKLPDRLKRATVAMRQDNDRLKRIYTSIEDAVDARMKATSMRRDSAQLVVERNLRQVEGGYAWDYDSRLRAPSSYYFTEEQVLAVLAKVHQQTLCVLSEDGYLLKQKERTARRLDALEHAVVVEVAGNHHMHMDDPEATAAAIRTFLLHN